MNAPVLYGQSLSEKIVDENLACRQIVKEINNFGVTQRQLLYLVYLLASQLENVEYMRAITNFVRQLSPDTFLIGTPEPDAEILGDNNGTSNV